MSGVVKVHNKAGVHWLLVDLEDFAKAEFVDVIGVQVNVDEEQHSGQLIHKGTNAAENS